MTNAWSNWSGFVTASPKLIATPADAGELAELVGSAPGPLRVAGAGHSFTPLVQSDGTIVSLEKIEGLVSHEAAANRARVRAGTRLGALMRILQDIGQGLPNMGDIDRQAIGGALGTATHGSGPTLGAYHTQLEALQLVDGQGKLREYSRAGDQDMIRARDAGLGQQLARERAEPALHSVADNRVADFLGDGDAETHDRIVIAPRPDDQHETGHGRPPAAIGRQKIRAARKHRIGRLAQADSFLRPRARRAASTLRPPGVALRERKPWRRLRTRLLGWKVRFIVFASNPKQKGRRTCGSRYRGARLGKRRRRVNRRRTVRSPAAPTASPKIVSGHGSFSFQPRSARKVSARRT